MDGPIDSVHHMTAQLRKSRWMTQLGTRLVPTSLTHIAMVGAHDAATHNISRDDPGEYAPDAPAGLVNIARPLQGLAHRIAADWARTQDMSIFDMLIRGVRYFDLRLSPRGPRHELWISHGLYSTPLWRVVEHIAKFYGKLLSLSPAPVRLPETEFELPTNLEVIVLDFQRLSGVEPGRGTAVLTDEFLRVMEPLMSLMPKPGQHLGTPLGELWQTGTRIFVLYPCPMACTLHHPRLLPRDGDSIHSTWFNKSQPAALVDDLKIELRRRRDWIVGKVAVADTEEQAANGLVQAPLHVLQAVLTPNNADFAHHVLNPLPGVSRSIADFAQVINSRAITLFSRHELVPDSRLTTSPHGADAADDAAAAVVNKRPPHVAFDGRNVLMLDFFERGRDEDTGLDAVELCVWINANRFTEYHFDAFDAILRKLRTAPSAASHAAGHHHHKKHDDESTHRSATPPPRAAGEDMVPPTAPRGDHTAAAVLF